MNPNERNAQKQQHKAEMHETLCASMEQAGYLQKDEVLTTSAYMIGYALVIPFVMVVWLYLEIRTYYFDLEPPAGSWNVMAVLFVLLVFCSIVVHELLHGIVWCLVSRSKWKHIHFALINGSPSCHIDVPLQGTHYLIGVLAPFVVLGLGSMVAVFIMPGIFLAFFSSFCIGVCSGDLSIALKAYHYRNHLIVDHPVHPGFIAFIKE